MKIGWQHSIAVGPLLVTKIDDVSWDVMTPDADVARVSEDPLGFGWLGEGWAVAAVEQAEQEYDRAECPTVELTAAELDAAYRDLAAGCVVAEAFHGEDDFCPW